MSDYPVYPSVDAAFIEQWEQSFVELVVGEDGVTCWALLGCLLQPLDELAATLAQE